MSGDRAQLRDFEEYCRRQEVRIRRALEDGNDDGHPYQRRRGWRNRAIGNHIRTEYWKLKLLYV